MTEDRFFILLDHIGQKLTLMDAALARGTERLAAGDVAEAQRFNSAAHSVLGTVGKEAAALEAWGKAHVCAAPVKPSTLLIGDVGQPGVQPVGNPLPNISLEVLADEFMALPADKRPDYFNAVSQYGVLHGANLGGGLDMVLRQRMGDLAFRQWLTFIDGQQGSTFSMDGLPDWLVQGLK